MDKWLKHSTSVQVVLVPVVADQNSEYETNNNVHFYIMNSVKHLQHRLGIDEGVSEFI